MRMIIILTVVVFCLMVPFVSPGMKRRRRRAKKENKLKLPTAIKREFVDEDILLDVDGVSFTMLPVEVSTVTNGKNGNNSYNNSNSLRGVELSSFYIGQTLVTKELWNAVMGSGHMNGTQNGKDLGIELQRPVEGVSNGDCRAFLLRLNEKTGKNFRLPTKAEWEFAACGNHKCTERIVRGEDMSSADLGLRLALN